MAVRGYGSSGTNIDTLDEVAALTWVDLRDTLRNWAGSWEDFGFLSIGDSDNGATVRTRWQRLFLFVYMLFLVSNQNGKDRTHELGIHPHLTQMQRVLINMCIRENLGKLHPSQA